MSMDSRGAIRWVSAVRTHEGKVRDRNEDAVLAHPDCDLWAVADGMGGHAAGDRASAMVIEALQAVRPAGHPATTAEHTMECLERANSGIRDYAATEHGGRTMGTTVVVMIGGLRHGVCIWAGDSRLYRLREDVLEQISRDHSEVSRLVEEGLISEEEADGHPNANVITRSVGASPELLLDTQVFTVVPGDRFLLCSDGLYNELPPQELASALGQGGVTEATRVLLQRALDQGARDNVSVVVVEAEQG